ncbi:MAG TPA: nucleotidyltransferase domain-containing protein [Opitutales bacterium]|nr:nucleotidyltransferase domain-containing protein [Opitutales bacterium]
MSVALEHPAARLAEARLKAHIARHLPDAQVWLFGSRAKQNALRRSDFDLAVEPGSSTPDQALLDFETSVREDPEIIYPVDVIDLRRVSATLRSHIERDGVLWKN